KSGSISKMAHWHGNDYRPTEELSRGVAFSPPCIIPRQTRTRLLRTLGLEPTNPRLCLLIHWPRDLVHGEQVFHGWTISGRPMRCIKSLKRESWRMLSNMGHTLE